VWLRPLKAVPSLIRLLAWLLALIGQHPLAEKIRWLYDFQKEAAAKDQKTVLRSVRRHHPSNTRFVVLPMDLSAIGHGAPPITLKDQHDELSQLAQDPTLGRAVIPFATIDPRADPQASELTRALDALHFKGVKIYPRLGFAPDHPTLMTHVYPKMQAENLPLMTHCSRGGVQGRDVDDYWANRYTDPRAYLPVLQGFPNLRICLAHFGGQYDWKSYVEAAPGYRRDQNWQVQIREMIGSGAHPGLWTDISYTLFHFEDYIPFLRLFLTADTPAAARLRRRTLFGSDFYMTRQEHLSEKAVCFRLRNALGEEIFRQIADENPRVWLGEKPDLPLV
jgi:predicted TIM-barrel fold metal-dependent hydrolase